MATSFDNLSPQRADEMRYIHENAGVKGLEERLEKVEEALRDAGLLEEEVSEESSSGQLELSDGEEDETTE